MESSREVQAASIATTDLSLPLAQAQNHSQQAHRRDMSTRIMTMVENTSESHIHSLAFTPDGACVVAGDFDGAIRRWNIGDAQEVGNTMKARGVVYSTVVSSNGRWIVTGDLGNKVTVWDTSTQEKVWEINEHTDFIRTVDTANDSSRLASGSDDGTVRVFNIATGQRLLPPLDHGDAIAGVNFSGNGGRIATATYFAFIRVYDSHNGDKLLEIQLDAKISGIVPLAWLSDNQNVFFVSPGRITSIDTVASSHSEWPTHNRDSVTSIVTNGKFIACSSGPSVSFWDAASHQQIGPILEHDEDIECISLSPDARYLACGHGKHISIHNLSDIFPNTYFNERALTALQLPLMEVSNAALESWARNEFSAEITEAILSQEIALSLDPDHQMLANRSLIRSQLKDWTRASEDARLSLRIKLSPIGHIAMAIARYGQGDKGGALRAFDLVFRDCDPCDIQFLLLLKSILLFQCGEYEDAVLRMHDLIDTADPREAFCFMLVLASMYLKKGESLGAKEWLECVKGMTTPGQKCHLLTTITLIFGKGFEGPDLAAQRQLCENLYAEGHVREAAEMLLRIRETSSAGVKMSLPTTDWFNGFAEKCIAKLELIGDAACSSEKYIDAILQYSVALSLGPPKPAGILLKRSIACSAVGRWDEALRDADELIKIDPADHQGYGQRHVALHGAGRYDEAINAFRTMLSLIEQSQDLETRILRSKYISPSQTISSIEDAVRLIMKLSPLVLIDVNTGRLCDGAERTRIFKSDPIFKELVSSMTTHVDEARIVQVVAKFFGYAIFSHVWEGKEPTFQDVNFVQSIHNLEKNPLNDKLQRFCEESHKLGYRWAWSDTCCIDKTTSSILTQSLTSMYKWYAEAAVTLVLLRSIKSPSKIGDLASSVWMTRAWTLQELLSSKIVRFYDEEWQPYLGDTRFNHKESSEIVQELSDAFNIPHQNIVDFSPDHLGVRDKLRLASTRNATIEEDIAYSLIGIFKSDIRPQYGEGEAALGHLLEEILARSGEVSILAWTGRSSQYNTCLPATISVYSQTPYAPPTIAPEDMQIRVAEKMTTLPRPEAMKIYRRVLQLPPARFANRRLHLPCIVFPIRKLVVHDVGSSIHRYRVRVSGLGIIELTTADVLPKHDPQRLVLVNPWISDIRGPLTAAYPWDRYSDSTSESEGDWESDLDRDSDEEWMHSESGPSSAGASAAHVDEYNLALQVVVRLGEPFGALLLLQQPGGEYHRVATENEIVVKGLGSDINTSKDVRVEVLEIL